MSEHAEPSAFRRILWLLLVPVGCALVPLLVLGASDSSLGALPGLVVGAIPLIGGLGALGYASSERVRMLPMVPFIAAGALFLFVLLVSVNMTAGGSFDFGPVKAIGAVLPVLAVAGGLIGLVWLPEPEPEWESDQDADQDAATEA